MVVFPHELFKTQLNSSLLIYKIITSLSEDNPHKDSRPSLDLGAYYDVAHGLLFGAKEHIMIDHMYNSSSAERICERLKALGAEIIDVKQEEKRATMNYTLGSQERTLTMLSDDIQTLFSNPQITGGLSALVMKGRGGIQDEGTRVEAVLPIFQDCVLPGGLYLGVTRPVNMLSFKEQYSGLLPFSTQTGDDDRFVEHTLYRRKE